MSEASGLPNFQEGGTQGARAGILKRRLKSLPLCRLSSTTPESGQLIEENTRWRLMVKGLSGVLNVHIAVAIESESNTPVRPADVPAGGATMQLTPINLFPDVAKKMYLREILQDPTATDNADHPMAADIPFGWEGATEADQIEIEVNLIIGVWPGTLLNGRLIAQCTIEYNGAWWDVKAISQALSQVTFEGGPDDLGTVLTAVEIG